jgi:hypothetical protein
MPEMTSGTALRQLQAAQAGMKKVRQAMRLAKGDPDSLVRISRAGWQSLASTHKQLAEIPYEAASEPVMTKQLAVQRYATSLLVRLRRIARNEVGTVDDDSDDQDD